METMEVQCPYCGEQVEMFVERDVQGEMVQDCAVCCQPWQVFVSWEQDVPHVQVGRAQ